MTRRSLPANCPCPHITHPDGAPWIYRPNPACPHHGRRPVQAATVTPIRKDPDPVSYPIVFATPGIRQFAEDIDAERGRQLAKWGDQHHPDGTGQHPETIDADVARMACQNAAEGGYLDWLHILREEVTEAFAESDPARLRTELIQVAAVCAAWIADIDSRGAANAGPALSGTAPATPAMAELARARGQLSTWLYKGVHGSRVHERVAQLVDDHQTAVADAVREADGQKLGAVEDASATPRRAASLATPCGGCTHPYNWHVGRTACEFGNETNRCGCTAFVPGDQTAADAQRAARRASLGCLLSCAERMALSTSDAGLLRQHIEAEIREADTARAEAKRQAAISDSTIRATKQLLERRTNTLRKRAEDAGHEREVALADLDAANRARAEAQRDRDQHAAVLSDVLSRFTRGPGVGHECLTTVPDHIFKRWQAVVAPTVERPWWQQVALYEKEAVEATKHVLELKATVERVRATTAYMRSVTRTWGPAADLVDTALDESRQAPAEVAHPETNQQASQPPMVDEKPEQTAMDSPPGLHEQLATAIEHEVYEYRERTTLWGETEGVTEEITRLATRGALTVLGQHTAALAEAQQLIAMQKQLLGRLRSVVMTAITDREDQGVSAESCDRCGRDHMNELYAAIVAADKAYAEAFPATTDGPARPGLLPDGPTQTRD